MVIDIAEFGEKVRSARIERGMSQLDLERATGVKQNVISNIERGVYSKGAVTDSHRIIATHIGIDVPDEIAVQPQEYSNGALTEITQAHVIQLHKPVEGFPPKTDALITCLVALEALSKDEAAQIIKCLEIMTAG
jgi:transcriptional regulator with XRE-family HTH domain